MPLTKDWKLKKKKKEKDAVFMCLSKSLSGNKIGIFIITFIMVLN